MKHHIDETEQFIIDFDDEEEWNEEKIERLKEKIRNKRKEWQREKLHINKEEVKGLNIDIDDDDEKDLNGELQQTIQTIYDRIIVPVNRLMSIYDPKQNEQGVETAACELNIPMTVYNLGAKTIQQSYDGGLNRTAVICWKHVFKILDLCQEKDTCRLEDIIKYVPLKEEAVWDFVKGTACHE